MPKTRTTALLLCVLLTACASPVRHIPPPQAGTEQNTSGNLIIFYDGQSPKAKRGRLKNKILLFQTAS